MRPHEATVRKILQDYPGAETVGFSKAVAKIIGFRFPDIIVPDAWLLDADNSVLTAFEVEDGHHLSAGKKQRYARLCWWLEDFDWDLRLMVCGRFGEDLRQFDVLAHEMRAIRRGLEELRAKAPFPTPTKEF